MPRKGTKKKCINCDNWKPRPTPQQQAHRVCSVSGKSTHPHMIACDYWIGVPTTLDQVRAMQANA